MVHSLAHSLTSALKALIIAEVLRRSLESASGFVDTNGVEVTVSDMDPSRGPKRPRRSFTDEFKAGAVRLVVDEGKTVPQVARDLDLTESALRTWVERARADAGKGKPGVLTTAEKEELAALRKRVRQLEVERDILKKAAAFFAKENS
jgi:transposase